MSKELNALKKKMQSIVAGEEKLKKERALRAIRGFRWIEVQEGQQCDQNLDPDSERVMRGRKQLSTLCEGRPDVGDFNYNAFTRSPRFVLFQNHRCFFCYCKYSKNTFTWVLKKDTFCKTRREPVEI